MPELSDNIISNNINTLSRNTPLALVVGAAGFIGSHLCEELLKKDIQVIGVDNFSTGKKDYLEISVKFKKFHFININAQDLDLELPRLDYIFIAAGSSWSLSVVLNTAKKFNSKIVFISTIELYDRNVSEDLSWFKEAESKIARFVAENKLNARIVRLSAIFGPRMYFGVDDPMIRLIQASLLGRIQEESTALEFSTRALFVSDAVDLIIKSMLSGSTAQKIFDGVNDPVKVSEIKQILLDPIWHETRRFTPTELPPWPTPNLENTKKHLSWRPKINIVTALRTTLQYFKQNEVQIPELEMKFEVGKELKDKVSEWKKDIDGGSKKEDIKQRIFSKQKIFILFLWAVIIYGLIYPFFGLLWNGYQFRENILLAKENLKNGEIEKSIENISGAKENLGFANRFIAISKLPLEMGILNQKLETAKNYLSFYDETLLNIQKSLRGAKLLYESFETISGERQGVTKDIAEIANSQLESAYSGFSETSLDLKRNSIKSLPFMDIDYYSQLVSKNIILSKFLPQIASSNKNYIVLIENEKRLIGSGGEILTVSSMGLENGKIKQIETEDTESIDSKLSFAADLPQILRNDLNIQKGGLKYSNFDADFPTAARLTNWFYSKSKGKNPDGLISADIEAMEELLDVIGPINLEEKGISLNKDNLRNFLESGNKLAPIAVNRIFSKLFFVPDLNWPEITNWFGSNVEKKHIMLYFENKKILTFLLSEGNAGVLSRPSQNGGDFLSIFETAVGDKNSNNQIDRRFTLSTNVESTGLVGHNLRIGYTSFDDTNPYKNRLRIFLPEGSKLTKASWGEADLLKIATSYIEHRRLAYTFVFEVLQKEQKSLILEYTTPIKLDLTSNKLTYRLDVIKQPGTSSEAFDWRIAYPENLKTSSQTNVSTDLSTDRSFDIEFEK